jgi:hypothetical protein
LYLLAPALPLLLESCEFDWIQAMVRYTARYVCDTGEVLQPAMQDVPVFATCEQQQVALYSIRVSDLQSVCMLVLANKVALCFHKPALCISWALPSVVMFVSHCMAGGFGGIAEAEFL